jgi:acyl carrier protein
MNTLDAIKQHAASEFEVKPEDIDVDAPFDKIGIDSLGLVEFIFELEDLFKVRVNATEVEGVTTLRQLAQHIDGLIARKAACVE